MKDVIDIPLIPHLLSIFRIEFYEQQNEKAQ